MTALIGFFSRQIERTTHSVRRLHWLMALLVIIALAGVVLTVQRTPTAIKYPARYLTPTPAALCAGETFTFPVVVSIEHGDAVSQITEGWCNAKTGVCPWAFQNAPNYVNFLEPYSVSTQATRTVPADLPPGDWQLRHCNETHSDGVIDVTCYQVGITVQDCAK